METLPTGEIETELVLPVTVEFIDIPDEEDPDIIRITVKGVEGIVEDISTIQYNALVKLIKEQLEAEGKDKREAKALSEADESHDERFNQSRQALNGEQR